MIKQNKILEMKEDIRKVFECSTISSFKPKFECKRPYLNIVCEKFMVRKDPKPKPKKSKENQKKEIKYDETRLVHGLLRCKSGRGLWNRDRNGSSNIYKIAETAINKLERPSYLCRETHCDIKSQSLGVLVSRQSRGNQTRNKK